MNWTEVPMWKALKVWANNKKHIKCEVGNSTYLYHGQQSIKLLEQDQVTDGKWYVSE